MRCGRCGNDNAETNRFCGMCGAPLVPQGQVARQTLNPAVAGNTPTRQQSDPSPIASRPAHQSSQAGVTRLEAVPAEQRPAPLSSSRREAPAEPGITGPSFLGLGTPDRHRNSSAGRDPLQPSSGNLDYLLDDDEEPKGGGGKLILFVLAVALAGGFGYLHWKQGGFDWLNGGDKKAAVTKPSPESAQPASDSGGTPGASAAPTTSAPPPAANPPVTPVPTDAAPANPLDSTATNASSSTASQPAPSQAAPSQTSPAAASNGSDAAPDSTPHASAPDSDQQSAQDEPVAAEKPVTRKPATAKPSVAKPSAAKTYDAVVEAERYIYGRGVRQDCDHGLHLLKPAAEQSNPKAMISLGALYSTGTCTPRDLPTAYRWFATALHKQPDNQALQDDLQKLWSQMTPPERQLAIKLSQ